MLSHIKFYSLLALALVGDTARPENSDSNHEGQAGPLRPADLLDRVLDEYPDLSRYAECVDRYPSIFSQMHHDPGVTILAPTDEAFAKYAGFDIEDKIAVVNLLQYHMLQGQIFFDSFPTQPQAFKTLLFNISSTNVTNGQRLTGVRYLHDEIAFTSGTDHRALVASNFRDIKFFDGVIQPIDTILVPPLSLVDTAEDRFQLLYAFLGALYKTKLADQVLYASDVTLFVPNNEAFQQVVGPLSLLSEDELRNLISYHIILGEVVYSEHLADGSTFNSTAVDRNTAQPLKLTLHLDGNERFVDSSQIVDPDVLIANGVVHIISHVLNPKNPAQPVPGDSRQSQAFELGSAGETGSRVPTPFMTNLPCRTDCETATETQTSWKDTHKHKHTQTHRNQAAPTGQSSLVGILLGAGAMVAGAL